MKLALEEEGLYLANDVVTLVNMELGVVRKFERGEEGFVLIPGNLLSAPSVLIVEDGGVRKYYVLVSIGRGSVEVLQVRGGEVYRNIVEGHVMAMVSSEAPFEGNNAERAIAYLRAL